MRYKYFLLIILLALVFRFTISPLVLHVDLLSNAEWGQWIYENGTKGFFENSIWTYSWPTQPPLANLLFGFERHLYQWFLELFRNIGHTIVAYHLAPGHMRWWFSFTIWFDQAKFDPVIVFPKGYIATMKLLPILADIGIATILYWLAEKVRKGRGEVFSTLYLFSPFSWYLSAYWGQTDQLAFIFVILSFILEFQRKFTPFTPLLFATGVLIKPTSLVLAPLFAWTYIRNGHKRSDLLLALALVLIIFWISTAVFSGVNNLTNTPIYWKDLLVSKIFLKSEFRVSTNAFNFWRILIGNKALSDQTPILLIPARIWGLAAYGLFNFVAFKLVKKIDLKSGFVALFVVSAGSFLFMTNMLDRYFFAGIVSGLFVCVYYPRLLKYWVILSLIYWLNLFNQWWHPEWLELLEVILRWQGGLVTRMLAFVNVLIFLAMARLASKKIEVNRG